VRIETIESGFFKTNTYLVIDELTNRAMLIDPTGSWRKIAALISQTGAEVTAIVNTHAHFDHVNRNHEAKQSTGAPLLIHRAEGDRLPRLSLPSLLLRGRPKLSPPADRLLEEGDEIEVGSLRFEVIHTPGHTPGGISLRYKKHIFTGDAIFAGAIGRTDLKGGNYDQLAAALKDKLFILSDDIFLHPGHGPRTTIEAERKYNIFVKLRPEQVDELMLAMLTGGRKKRRKRPEPAPDASDA